MLPERINVMRVVSYDVKQIIEDIHAHNEKKFDDITLSDVLWWIEDWVMEDFDGNTKGLIYQDENGRDL